MLECMLWLLGLPIQREMLRERDVESFVERGCPKAFGQLRCSRCHIALCAIKLHKFCILLAGTDRSCIFHFRASANESRLNRIILRILQQITRSGCMHQASNMTGVIPRTRTAFPQFVRLQIACLQQDWAWPTQVAQLRPTCPQTTTRVLLKVEERVSARRTP